jgi:hypothetical protein
MNKRKDVNELWKDFLEWKDRPQKLKSQATLQRLLNEYPTEALERMQVWAEQRWLQHDWDSCLNAAAVGHPIEGPMDAEQEIGVPMATAAALAEEWDTHLSRDLRHRVIRELVEELRQSRSRRHGAPPSGSGATEPELAPAVRPTPEGQTEPV